MQPGQHVPCYYNPANQEPSRTISSKEHNIIKLVNAGCKNSEIGVELGLTEHVIKNYLRVIYDKLGLWNRVELALWYEARQNEGTFPGVL